MVRKRSTVPISLSYITLSLLFLAQSLHPGLRARAQGERVQGDPEQDVRAQATTSAAAQAAALRRTQAPAVQRTQPGRVGALPLGIMSPNNSYLL
jgi:hypothetical protein